MSFNRPRTSPLQPIPSRPARSKYALQSRRAEFANPGYDRIPGYVNATFPDQDTATKKAIVNVVERHFREHGTIPTPAMLFNRHNHLLDGLIEGY